MKGDTGHMTCELIFVVYYLVWVLLLASLKDSVSLVCKIFLHDLPSIFLCSRLFVKQGLTHIYSWIIFNKVYIYSLYGRHKCCEQEHWDGQELLQARGEMLDSSFSTCFFSFYECLNNKGLSTKRAILN